MAPLGKSHAVVAPSSAVRLFRRLFGIEDFHSHIRWNAIVAWIDPAADLTLEVGVNTGVMTVEVAKRVAGRVVASEFDPRLLDVARQVIERAGINNVELGQADLRDLSESCRFDQALVIDVLEHIDDDEVALRHLAGAMLPGGRLVVSVPTPRYPDVFGRAFHEEIGHVRDGYALEELTAKLESAGFDVQAHRYYTGRVASWACSRYYRDRPAFRRLWLPALPVLRALSLRNEPRASSSSAASVAVVAVRRQA